MSEYTCTSCGESFDTLTKKRLHQRECSAADVDVDVSDLDLEETVERAVAELLICDVCGHENDGAESIATDETEAGLGVVVGFECSVCAARNDNEAILA
jgi:rubredoxin